MSSQTADWSGLRGHALSYPRNRPVSEWVDENVVLPFDSAEAGAPYQTKRTPYVREWMDSAGAAWVRQITVVASTQVGKTQSALNILAYVVCNDPDSITWVMPTREDAAEFGENKVMAAVESTPAWRRHLTGTRFDARRRQIRFRTCRLLFRGSVIPKELAQYPARWLFGDECDKWPPRAKGEAPPFNLARERTRTFWNHKIYLSSTPTTDEALIWREFERGDQRRYHVPCPHCGRFQVLRWKQIKWDSEAHETEDQIRATRAAWYECEHCSGRIDDRHKQSMLERGFWCPDAVDIEDHLVDGVPDLPPDTSSHRSYHIWAGYSPWLAWWEIVAEFLRTRGTPEFQNFINSWLGEPWVERVEETRPDELRECVGGYHRGEVPEGVRVITAGVDVQKHFLVYTIRGWGLDMESWLLDHGRVDDFEQLAGVLFLQAWPRGLMLHSAFVDTNYRTSEVIDFTRAYPAKVKMCRGQEFDEPIPFRAQSVERHPRTGAPIGTMKAWHVNVGMFKDLVAASMRTGGIAAAAAFHVYEEVDRTYLGEMTAEHKIMVRSKKGQRERWVKKGGSRQNHYWDTEVYNRALAHLIRVDMLRREGEPGPAGRRQRQAQSRKRADEGGPRLGWRRT